MTDDEIEFFLDDADDDDDDWPRYESKVDVVIAFVTYALIAFLAGYLYWQMFVRTR